MTTKADEETRKKLELMSDPAAFRQVLLVDRDGRPTRYASICADWQRADHTALDPAWKFIAGRSKTEPALRRLYSERPRGASKTTDLSIAVLWALWAATRPIVGIAAAADADQARLIVSAMARIVSMNPWLSIEIEVLDKKVRNKITGAELTVISSDAGSSYGLTPDFLCLDEITVWTDRGKDLWDSLASAAAKRANCVMVVIANAGWQTHWTWPLRESIRTDPCWRFSRLESPPAWIDQNRLDEQRRILTPAAYSRVWENLWQTGEGDALDADDIRVAFSLKGPTIEHEQGFAYVGGLDLSVTTDCSAFCVLGINVGHDEIRERPKRKTSPINRCLIDAGLIEPRRPDGDDVERIHHPGDLRIKLCNLTVWNPRTTGRIDFAEIEEAIVEAHRIYDFSALGTDPFQSEALTQRLQQRGIPIYTVAQVGAVLRDTCMATLDAFRERRLSLYSDPYLLRDVQKWRVIERHYGIRLESPRDEFGHGDAGSSLAMALYCAKRTTLRPGRAVQGDLVCWPNTTTVTSYLGGAVMHVH